jgi:large subunit ribosomal protein L15
MKLDEILSKAGAHKRRTRYGRGTGSGKGKTSGRGTKGLGARAGSGHRPNYEGGSNPQFKRIPQRGFSNFDFRKQYAIINVCDLEAFDNDAKVDAALLVQAGLVDDKLPVKVLGDGELTKKLTVVAAKFTVSALDKILKVGGTAQTPDGKNVEKPVEKAPPPPVEKPKAQKGEKAPKSKKDEGEAQGDKPKAPKAEKPAKAPKAAKPKEDAPKE